MEVIAKITAAEATIIKAATIMAADSMEDSPEMETTSEAGEVVDGEEEAANAWKPVKVAVGAAVTIKTRYDFYLDFFKNFTYDDTPSSLRLLDDESFVPYIILPEFCKDFFFISIYKKLEN